MQRIKNLLIKYREIILYVIFGGLTTIVDWAVYFPLVNIIGVDYQAANVLGWIVAVLFAYVTNRIFVFQSKVTGFCRIVSELLKFAGGRIFSLLVQMLLMWVLVDLYRFSENYTKLFVAVIVVIINYVISRLFVFVKRK